MPSRPDGSSPSVIDGTPSSRSAHSTLKRNRQRSTSPDFTPGSLAPRRDDDDPFRGRRIDPLPTYVVKQYLAVETAAPIVTEEVERGVLGESTEREAEYLLDDGSQLAREEVRGVLGGTWEGNGNREEDVHWRTVTVKQLAIEGMLNCVRLLQPLTSSQTSGFPVDRGHISLHRLGSLQTIH